MEKYNLMKQGMNLQLFANTGGSECSAGAGEGSEGNGEGKGSKGGDKTPPAGSDIELPKTQEELEKLLQSEADKRVTGALKTAKEKWEADYQAKIEAEKAEAEKLAKMTASEKEKHLLEKQKNELAEKEKTIAAREMKLTKIDIFSEKKLPIKLVDYVQGNTADEVKANIETFEKEWRSAIDEAVNERLKGKSPFNVSSKDGNDSIGIAKQLIEFNKNSNTRDLEKAKESYFK
ncbi:DUF4355 domain-containing protein [Clostridium tyrobutyricum]|uniref:DUF4355 domain-containing protein n=1 Tax=Clostridium tyrobutyricum TaxID=1519 RepID=UPI001C386D00|nr:DUF4355 domain-containing protein [Clostridium tyrobutyricum]MBV4423231.1 DUF4355 domain-containing protein [Clostridium tyrobutyricum]